MNRTVQQPIGQKRLTNVAVVRLRKHGLRFEIACYKNKVLSWRSQVEKDIDEVLQSHTVYANVSKGVLAKSKDLIRVFGTDDEEKICLEILEKGELQVAGKEREAQLSSQFRDIATIVMEKTINRETQRPYTISMIERLMREVHFAVDPNKSSKQQALELIKELEKHFPIARTRMRLRLVVPSDQGSNLKEKLEAWNAQVEHSEDKSSLFSVVCQVQPGFFRDCDALVRDCHGRLEVISMAVQKEGDGTVDEYHDDDFVPASSSRATESVTDQAVLSHQMVLVTLASSGPAQTHLNTSGTKIGISAQGELLTSGDRKKQQRCNTCNADVGDAKQYREHFKSDWHKHNLKRKMKQMPPLSPEECLLDTEVNDEVNDMDDYCR